MSKKHVFKLVFSCLAFISSLNFVVAQQSSLTIHVKREGNSTAPRIHIWTNDSGTDVPITNSSDWPNNLPYTTASSNGWYKYNIQNPGFNSFGVLFRFGTNQTADFKYFTSNIWILLNSSGNQISISTFNPDYEIDKIGFFTNDIISDKGLANYGLTYSKRFPIVDLTSTPLTSSSFGPGVSLSGFYGLDFYTTGKERMRVDWRGNVGIGVKNTDGIMGFEDIQSKLQVEDGDINSTGWSNTEVLRRIGFYTTDIDTISNTGFANYGLTYSKTFPIGNSSNFGPGVSLSGFFGLSFYTAGSEKLRISSDGYVGIGKTNPSSLLDVNGEIKALSINVNGEITALAIKGPSDIRFKKNLKPLENSLRKITELKGYSYEWRKDEFPDKNFKQGNDIGFVAQEVEKIFPEIVYTDKDDAKYKSIDYNRLVPVLVEAIKELQKEIDALKNELNRQK